MSTRAQGGTRSFCARGRARAHGRRTDATRAARARGRRCTRAVKRCAPSMNGARARSSSCAPSAFSAAHSGHSHKAFAPAMCAAERAAERGVCAAPARGEMAALRGETSGARGDGNAAHAAAYCARSSAAPVATGASRATSVRATLGGRSAMGAIECPCSEAVERSVSSCEVGGLLNGSGGLRGERAPSPDFASASEALGARATPPALVRTRRVASWPRCVERGVSKRGERTGGSNVLAAPSRAPPPNVCGCAAYSTGACGKAGVRCAERRLVVPSAAVRWRGEWLARSAGRVGSLRAVAGGEEARWASRGVVQVDIRSSKSKNRFRLLFQAARDGELGRTRVVPCAAWRAAR